MDDLRNIQDAIEAVEMLLEQSEDDEHDKTWNKAIRGAINAVKHHVPFAQPEYTIETHEERTENARVCLDAIKQQVKEQMLKYGFTAPDMTVTEFVEDCLTFQQVTGKLTFESNQKSKDSQKIDCINRMYELAETMQMIESHSPIKGISEMDSYSAYDDWSQPSAEPKKGKWIEHKDYPGLAYLCPKLSYFTTYRSNFCPNCGADMRGEQDDCK